jgi:hypothetical protein
VQKVLYLPSESASTPRSTASPPVLVKAEYVSKNDEGNSPRPSPAQGRASPRDWFPAEISGVVLSERAALSYIRARHFLSVFLLRTHKQQNGADIQNESRADRFWSGVIEFRRLYGVLSTVRTRHQQKSLPTRTLCSLETEWSRLDLLLDRLEEPSSEVARPSEQQQTRNASHEREPNIPRESDPRYAPNVV